MENNTLEYWLDWVKELKAWIFARPAGIQASSMYEVLDVPYEALALIAKHYNRTLCPEDETHRQWVFVEIWHGMSMTEVLFKSPKRKFKYEAI